MSVPCSIRKCLPLSETDREKDLPEEDVRIRCCTCANSMSKTRLKSAPSSGLKTAILSMRFINSGVNFRRGGCNPGSRYLAVELLMGFLRPPVPLETELRSIESLHLGCPKIARHENHCSREIDSAVIPEAERGFIQDSEQQIPKRIARLLDLVEQHQTNL